MQLPTSIPEHDPSGLWALQLELLALAEQLVGERDSSKNIYQPAFHENGPHLRNTPTLDGAFAELGLGSKVSWPIVVFEMAHETIHLLNPTVSCTNWLEEGVAVEFSLYAQGQYGLSIHSLQSGPYLEALEMVRTLPGGTFSAAYRVRESAGSLNAATFEQLSTLFPTCESTGLRQLSKICVPR